MHFGHRGLVFAIITLPALTSAISFTYGVQEGDVALYQNEVVELDSTNE